LNKFYKSATTAENSITTATEKTLKASADIITRIRKKRK